jgi:hypothetical protein
MKPSQRYQIQLTGLPDYDTALLFKNEFVGLRNILNADLLNFESDGLSLFEVETSGGGNLAQLINSTVLKPLNAKLEGPQLKLVSTHGNVVRIALDGGMQTAHAEGPAEQPSGLSGSGSTGPDQQAHPGQGAARKSRQNESRSEQ